MKNFIKNNPILLLFFISTLAVLFFSVYTNNLMEASSSTLESLTGKRLQVLAHDATRLATVEELDEFHTVEDMEKPLYAKIKQRLAEFNASWGLLYTYFMRLHGDGKLQYIVDNVLDPEEMDNLDSLMDMYEAPRIALGGKPALHGIGDNLPEWANIMAAYVPIFDADGKVYCIVGVDLIDENIVDLRSSIRNMNILQIFSLFLAAITGGIGLILYRNKALASNQANIAKSQFLSSMSHEMRTPMNAIIGMTNIAKSSNDLEKKNYCIAKISDASTHLLGVINDILDMSKIEANKFELSFSEFCFEDMLDKLVRGMRFQVEEKQQTLNVASDRNIPPSIVCDEQHLSQSIANLLSNAVKFTPEKGSITLKAQKISETDGDCVIQIAVSDTGIGISKEQKEQLFQSFTQADNSTSRKFGGTGLGLAIAKRIIELLQGRIWIESELGQGSTFFFLFHAKRGSQTPHELAVVADKDAATGSKADDFSGRRILLADDTEINREIVLTMLEPTGLGIDCAENGKEALDIFSAAPEKYDMIFLDINMPEMDGYETARRIRALEIPRAGTIPVIAMTGNVFQDDIDRCLAAGMTSHLGKPLDFDILLKTLRSYLQTA